MKFGVLPIEGMEAKQLCNQTSAAIIPSMMELASGLSDSPYRIHSCHARCLSTLFHMAVAQLVATRPCSTPVFGVCGIRIEDIGLDLIRKDCSSVGSTLVLRVLRVQGTNHGNSPPCGRWGQPQSLMRKLES